LFPALALGAVACLAAPAAAQVVAYHDVSAASHQSQFTTLTGQGYRLIQLSVAGGLSTQRYSAIWRQTTGPNWVSSHNMNLTQYLNQRAAWIAAGYRPKYVTAAGTGADIVFAAVFVADGATVVDLFGNSEASFTTTCEQQRALGRWPVSVDIYNTATSPWYTAVFEPNPTGDAWGYVIDASPSDFSETFSAFSEADARIAALGMSDSQRYVSVWRDDRLGPWVGRSNYSSAGWQTQFTTLTGQGLWPTVIASGGSGANLRFAGSFSTELSPRARVMTKTGFARSEFAAFDTYMTNHMQNTGARNASIAIAKDGELLYARGYTWGEAGSQIAQPTSLFRIASCTKPLTSIAVHEMVSQGQLSLTGKPKTILGLTNTNANFGSVTLRDCLEYTSGLVRNYNGYTIASWANPASPVLPTTHSFGVGWLSQEPSSFTPGQNYAYSNANFLLASQCVRAVSGQSMQAYLQANVYAPLGITRSRVAASEVQNLAPGEIQGYAEELWLAASNLHTDRRRKASQYAVDLGLADGSGGMAFSTVDFVRLLSGVYGLGQDWLVLPPAQQASMLARHTFLGTDGAPAEVCQGSFAWTPRSNGVFAYSKGGSLDDASTSVIWRTDGVAIAVFVAKGGSGVSTNTMNNYVEQMTSWPTTDLFPTYGLPAFQRSPAVTSLSPTSIPNVTNTPIVVTGERLDTTTAVQFQFQMITATTPANWHDGWFRVVSPTQLEFYPPQGLAISPYALVVHNAVGASTAEFVSVTGTSGPLVVAAPPQITTTQTFRVYCGSGSLPALSIAAIGFSTSNVPSSAPGIVDLGIGNGFSDLAWTDFRFFDAGTRSVFWSIPPLPWPDFHVQAMGFDPTTATPFPLPSSNVRSIDVQ